MGKDCDDWDLTFFHFLLHAEFVHGFGCDMIIIVVHRETAVTTADPQTRHPISMEALHHSALHRLEFGRAQSWAIRTKYYAT